MSQFIKRHWIRFVTINKPMVTNATATLLMTPLLVIGLLLVMSSNISSSSTLDVVTTDYK